ncbi:dTDP-4-dehydrorhamnose 3,5-epimerase [Bradyrhizobium sp.]|uniref:polysaccharide biosynthesis C-terminal domain-containing protein n=1 Tax=Bradyrhizobium sp. TaxID=376 RepID=UPI003C733F31
MTNIRSQSVLEGTISAATRDAATVSPDGSRLQRLTRGVAIRRLVTQTDSRGTVTELFDQRWREQEPLVFCYSFTIRPGVAKGWSLHRRHQDRYALLQGEMELILFDPRPDSPTCGEVCRIVISEHDRCLVNVPIDVWHADHNIGTRDVVVVNFPTIEYDHAAPDKWRLPLDTPLIPHRFPAGTSGG